MPMITLFVKLMLSSRVNEQQIVQKLNKAGVEVSDDYIESVKQRMRDNADKNRLFGGGVPLKRRRADQRKGVVGLH